MYKSTILIPTYNRSNILRKNLEFLASTFDFNIVEIIILDGSDNTKEKENNEKNSFELNFKYFFYANLSLWERIACGIELATTNIISLLDDEDVIDYDGYLKCVDFLKGKKDYACVHGGYKNFIVSNGILQYENTYPNTNIENNNFYIRIKEFMCPYNTPLFYAVFQRNILVKVFDYLIKYNIPHSDYITTELLIGIITLLNGKSKGIRDFYIGRNRSNESFAPRFEYKKYILDYYDGISYKKTVEIIKQIVAEECKVLNINFDEDILESLCARWLISAIDLYHSEKSLNQKLEEYSE